jgi:hypothetical protein
VSGSVRPDEAQQLRQYLVPVAGAVIGASFFIWIAGLRVISPTEIDWVMKSDWRIHFLGWHLFRGEPWHWPPGRLDSYYHAPTGTAIGYTDSLPLIAFALKPFERWLPMPMQYLGLWMLVCFALQGAFGVLLVRVWSRSVVIQLLGSVPFVLVPTLLNRVFHPALCAHWTILWSLFLYFRWKPGASAPILHLLALGLIVGFIHPYLTVMVLAICFALTLKIILSRSTEWVTALGGFTLCVAAVGIGWWASGLFVLPADSISRPGFTVFSMNLLAPITPSGWSSLMPAVATAADGQAFEGFQYLGVGVVSLVLLAALLCVRQWHVLVTRTLAPLVGVAMLLAFYALSPRVTLADTVVFDLSTPALERLAVFGVTGRFFWPCTYLLLTISIAAVSRQLSSVSAATLLLGVCVLQLADLRQAYTDRRALARSQTFHTWADRPTSPTWAAVLAHYDHIVLYNPLQCGPEPITFEAPAYLAGLYGLTINSGEAARASEPQRATYCAALDARLSSGMVDDREVYLVSQLNESRLRAKAPQIRCGDIDNVRVCVTAHSYAKWRDAARFE